MEADEYACSAQKEGAVHMCVTTSSDLMGISSSQNKLGSTLLEDFTLALSYEQNVSIELSIFVPTYVKLVCYRNMGYGLLFNHCNR